MSIKYVRVALAVLCLSFVTVSFVGANNGVAAQQGAPLFQPAFLAAGPAVATCQLKGGGGGNCDTDADCPSGSYCDHDPIALGPYCVAGSSGTSLEF
jgi:hypothetical protein